MATEYSCHRCGRSGFKKGQAVLGHLRWCQGAKGVARELRDAASAAAASQAASAAASPLLGAAASPAASPPTGWRPAPLLPAQPPPDEVLLGLRQLGERMERVEKVLGNHVEHLGQRVEESQGLSPIVWLLIGASTGFGLALLLGLGGESAPAKVGSTLGSKLLETGATTLLRKGLNRL